MAKLPSIPEKYHQKIMNWTADGYAASTIQSFLKDELKIKTSIGSIYRLINSIRKDRQEIAKAKYAAAVEKTATQDINIMGEVINKLHNDWKESSELKKSLDILGELRLWIRDKMVLSGIDKDDLNKDHQAVKDELIEELKKIKNG